MNNSAVYGPNIGSYPVRILFVDKDGTEKPALEIDGVPSGQIFPEVLFIQFYDADNQISTNINSYRVKITPMVNTADVQGVT